eukprot:scaffold40464_cov63-Phaeocystis_antarctica.AAC.6
MCDTSAQRMKAPAKTHMAMSNSSCGSTESSSPCRGHPPFVEISDTLTQPRSSFVSREHDWSHLGALLILSRAQ